MTTISINYSLVWQLKSAPQYKFTNTGICINTQRGKILKKVLNGGSIGYCINGKFISLTKLRSQLVKIEQPNCPF